MLSILDVPTAGGVTDATMLEIGRGQAGGQDAMLPGRERRGLGSVCMGLGNGDDIEQIGRPRGAVGSVRRASGHSLQGDAVEG